MNKSQIDRLIKSFQQQLDTAASAKTKTWWEGYMKHVIPFRGVGIPKIRSLLAEWRAKNGLADLGNQQELEIALEFFNGTFTEDKLTGILYVQDYLIQKFDWKEILPHYEELYLKKLIFDWNVCDWFCVRILGPGIPLFGMPYATALAIWKDSPYLWQARSALVPFIKVADQNVYYPLIERIGSTLIQRKERFAKTAVGWVLRDISKYDSVFVSDFIGKHLEHFNREVLRNATKYFTQEEKKYRIHRLKSINI
jgi:3-methyladenine DNA glycosylase AlkD